MEGEREAREVRENVEQYEIGWGWQSELRELIEDEGFPGPRLSYRNPAFLRGMIVGSGFYRELIPKVQAFYAEYELRRIRDAERMGRLEEEVLADRIAQVRLDQTIRRLLVAPAFPGAVSALAGTDLSSPPWPSASPAPRPAS